MARRAPRYKLVCGDVEHILAKWQFEQTLHDGMAIPDPDNKRIAHVNSRFRAVIHPIISFHGERLGDELRFELRETPVSNHHGDPDGPAGIHSQFAMILRRLIYEPPYNVWLTRIRESVGEIR